MAISPQDAARHLDAKIKRALTDLEATIDRQLAVKWFTGCGGVYINVATEQFTLPTVAPEIARRYKNWQVDPIGEDSLPENEGQYLLYFSPPRK